jgi:ABC-type sugar transport system substrate-binding protein
MSLFAIPLRRFAGAAAIALGLAVTMVGLSGVAAQEKPKASPPVLVTSLGQSLDAFQIQLAVRRAGIPYKYDARAEVDQLDEVKTLFLGVGASLKGFGEAGITIKDELARAGQLLDAAKSRGILIVVLHVGGEERRDALSNQLIELAAPRAKLLVIGNDSDADGKFAEIAKAGNIPLVVIDNVLNLKGPLQELFAGG